MSFSLYGTTWIDGVTIVPAAYLNKVNVDVSRAVDGLNGGDYTLTADIHFIGSTGDIVVDSLDAVVKSGRSLQFESGSDLQADSGSTSTFDGTVEINGTANVNNGGILEIESGGLQSVKSGATLEINSGGVFEIENGANGHVRAGGTFTVSGLLIAPGRLYIGDFADFIVQSGGEVELQSGSSFSSAVLLTVTAGGITVSGGTVTIGSGATFTSATTLNVTAGGVNVTGGALTVGASATGSLAGAVTRTGSMLVSGSGAVTRYRVATGPDATQAVAATAQDILVVPDITANRTWTITSPASGSGQICWINQVRWVQVTNDLTLLREDASTIAKLPGDAGGGFFATNSVCIWWDGTRWMALSWSGNVVAHAVP